MIIVPTDTPGVNILRDVPTMGEPDHKTGEPGGHAEIKYEDVRGRFENIVGGEACGGVAGACVVCVSPATKVFPGPGPHPPRHALARPVSAGLRHAVRAL